MAPTFESVKSFGDVPIGDQGVDMHTFLEATTGLIEILEFIGSALFALLSFEMKTSHSALEERYEKDPEKVLTLEALIRNGATSPLKEDASKLVYLLRCLRTVGSGLKDLKDDPEADTVACFQRAYDASMSSQHWRVVRGIVAVAMKTAPKRSDIYEKLERECPGGRSRLDLEMSKCLEGLYTVLDHLAPVLKEAGYGEV